MTQVLFHCIKEVHCWVSSDYHTNTRTSLHAEAYLPGFSSSLAFSPSDPFFLHSVHGQTSSNTSPSPPQIVVACFLACSPNQIGNHHCTVILLCILMPWCSKLLSYAIPRFLHKWAILSLESCMSFRPSASGGSPCCVIRHSLPACTKRVDMHQHWVAGDDVKATF